MLRRVLIVFCSLLWMSLNVYAANAAKPTAQKLVPLDGIVAVINDQIITRSQLNQAVGMAKAELKKNSENLPNDSDLQKQVLNQMIYRDLQLQIAKRNNLAVNDDELNQAIATIAQQNNITVAQLEQEVQKQGISVQQFRKQIREEATIAKLQREAIASEVKVTPDEVAAFMKSYHSTTDARTEYHLADILVSLPESPSSQQVQAAENKAQAMVDKLRKGANFKEMAIAQSDGENALEGGDLGWRTLAGMPSVFAENVQGLKTGAVVGPIRAGNGFHVLKVLALRNPNRQTVNQQQAQQILFERKFQEKLQDWLQQMREQAYVKVML